MEQADDTRSLPTVVLHTVILVVTAFLTLTGNSLVCFAFYRNRSLRTVTNFYVLSLAIADLMIGTFCFPAHAIASGLRKWPFDNNFSQITGLVVELWVQVSLCILALVSINRYVCVVRQNKYLTFFSRKKHYFLHSCCVAFRVDPDPYKYVLNTNCILVESIQLILSSKFS